MRALSTVPVLCLFPAASPLLVRVPVRAPVATAAAIPVGADIRWRAVGRAGQILRVTLGTRGG